jgi:hypothetical protein
MIGGHLGDSNPDPGICYVQHSFFSLVSCGNRQPEHYGQPTEHKPYLFDALIGTVKVPRLWVYYNLRDSEFYDRTLISIQPFPNTAINHSTQQTVKNLLPDLVAKYGEVDDYVTPELFALEETRVQQFKQKAVTLADRYLNRRIPDMNLGRMPAAMLIPWTIYDHSWYSIISEKNPAWCDVNFLSEKTAKCLAAMRVFVMFNAPGTLKYLRSLGFQTFHGEFIDESYDKITNPAERLVSICKEMQRIANLSQEQKRQLWQELYAIAQRNQQLFFSDAWQKTIFDEFVENYKRARKIVDQHVSTKHWKNIKEVNFDLCPHAKMLQNLKHSLDNQKQIQDWLDSH